MQGNIKFNIIIDKLYVIFSSHIVLYLDIVIINMDFLFKSNQSLLQSYATIISSTIVLSISVLYTYHLHLSYQRSNEPPVLWSWIPLLGNAIEMGSKPIEFLKDCSKKHKNIFGLVVAGI